MKMFEDETLQLVWEHGERRIDEVNADEHNQLYAEVADADLAKRFPKEWADAIKATETSDKEFAKCKERFEAFRAFCAQDNLPALPTNGFSVVWWACDLLLFQKKTVAQIRRSLDAIQTIHHEIGRHIADKYLEAAMLIVKRIEGGGGPGIPKPVTSPRPAFHEPERLAAHGQ